MSLVSKRTWKQIRTRRIQTKSKLEWWNPPTSASTHSPCSLNAKTWSLHRLQRGTALCASSISVDRLSGSAGVPNLFADDGTENQNKDVDVLVDAGKIIRIIAQIDVELSNSMIEFLFRSLKHRWLFMLSLTTFEAVCRAVNEYLTDHNVRIPHYALGGAVPLEVFYGTWTEESQALLSEESTVAATQRINFNRSQRCGICPA